MNNPKPVGNSRDFAVAAAELAAATRCREVVVLDLTGISPICDYFVIATGTSSRQMKSVAIEIAELAKQSNNSPTGSSDYAGESWVLVDCVDVLIHIFSPEARGYYDLENLWGDAKRVELTNQTKTAAP